MYQQRSRLTDSSDGQLATYQGATKYENTNRHTRSTIISRFCTCCGVSINVASFCSLTEIGPVNNCRLVFRPFTHRSLCRLATLGLAVALRTVQESDRRSPLLSSFILSSLSRNDFKLFFLFHCSHSGPWTIKLWEGNRFDEPRKNKGKNICCHLFEPVSPCIRHFQCETFSTNEGSYKILLQFE